MPSRPRDGGLVAHGGPHVFVADLENLTLDADDHHHLSRVLRVRPGDPLTASDGSGRWRSCSFRSIVEPSLSAEGAVIVTPRPNPALGVGFALVKGARPELIVQKLTELGIDHIQPFVAERSVVRWDDAKMAKNLIRLQRVGREAAMQSRRAWLPTISSVTAFGPLARRAAVARADMAGAPPSLDHALVLVGPEGGWTESERAAVPTTMAVASTVLRAETAAIAVGAVLVALRGGYVAAGSPVGGATGVGADEEGSKTAK